MAAAYFSARLHSLRLESQFAFDSKLFAAVLICLVARDKHLVVRTEDRDIRSVVAMLIAITTNLLSLHTKTIHITPSLSPRQLVNELFIQSSPPYAPEKAASRSSRRRSTLNDPAGPRASFQTHLAPRRQKSRDFSEGAASLLALRPSSELFVPSSWSTGTSSRMLAALESQEEHRRHLPQVLVLSGMEKASHSVRLKISEILRTRRVGSDQPDEDGNDSWALPRGFMIVWVRAEGGKKVPDWLVDLFALSCEAHQPFPSDADYEFLPDLKPAALVSSSEVESLHALAMETHLHHPLKSYLSDLNSAALHHPFLSSHITPRSRTDLVDFVKVARVLFQPVNETASPRGWNATTEDVRRVFVNSLAHRTTMRKVGRGEIMGVLQRSEEDELGREEGRLHVEGRLEELWEVENVLVEILERV